MITTVRPLRPSAMPAAAVRRSSLRCSMCARSDSNRLRLASVARRALPCGSRKLRAKPSLTVTSSPMVPVRPMRSSRMTFMSFSFGLSRSLGTVRSREPFRDPNDASLLRSLLYGVGHYADEAGALDGASQFTLLLCRNGGDAARHDLAALRSEERRVGKECRGRWGADH